MGLFRKKKPEPYKPEPYKPDPDNDFERVRRVFLDYFGSYFTEEITRSTSLVYDLEMDDADIYEVNERLCDEFDIEMDIEEEELYDVEAIVKYIKKVTN